MIWFKPRRRPLRREEGMTCLHLYPRNLRIPDWELNEDILLTLCQVCGKVLEIRFSSQPGEAPEVLLEKGVRASLGIIY
ncbi:MAG: hypothetical protein JSV27_00255 [Candidatus Bathyarchaeota archaeon]|nr:MAG: hypothetical protein JSV27_00255 [Candidatus Bathyarchaeota archaeon]